MHDLKVWKTFHALELPLPPQENNDPALMLGDAR